MALSDKKILTSERNATYVKSNQGQRLTGTVEQNKDAFDKFPQLIMDKYNALIDVLTELGLDSIVTDFSSRYTKTETDTLVSEETNDLVETITFTADDGKFAITTKGGKTTVIDTNIEKIPASFELVTEDGKTYLKVTNSDGSSTKADVTELVNIYLFNDTDTIDFTETEGVVTAVIKKNSITLDHLSLAAVSTLEGYVSAAASSASAASASASAAEASAENASTFEQSAKLYSEDAEESKNDAATNASNSAANASSAASSASQAAASVNQAASQAQAAANSATLSKSYAQGGTGTRTGEDTNNAKYYMEQAAAIAAEAGLGDMLKATYDPQGKAQDIFAYADSKADAKISKVSSPTAGNIPILTADGQIADSGKNAEEVGGSDLPEVTESDAGKALVVGSDGNWGAGEVAGNVFIAKYGVTTAEELEAAYQAGKAIFVTGMTAVECEIDFGEVLPLTNREAEYIFVFQGCDNSARKFSCACTPDSPAWGGGVGDYYLPELQNSEYAVQSKVIKAALDEKANTFHYHAPDYITSGRFPDMLNAMSEAAVDEPQIRDIYAGTTDMTAGTSTLGTGVIYLVYE